jgi:hypothetical protein
MPKFVTEEPFTSLARGLERQSMSQQAAENLTSILSKGVTG